MREKHRLLSDKVFEQKVADGTLTPELFTHEAHLRLAWILLKTYEFEQACALLCALIEAFDKRHGTGTKFNKELTLAASKTVALFTARSEKETFPGFISDHPELIGNFKELIGMIAAR